MNRGRSELILASSFFWVLALLVDAGLSLVALLCAPPTLVLLRRFDDLIRRSSSDKLTAYGRLLHLAQQSLQGLAIVKLHGGTIRLQDRNPGLSVCIELESVP